MGIDGSEGWGWLCSRRRAGIGEGGYLSVVPLPLIDIMNEQETSEGWVFAVGVIDNDGGLRRCELRMSYADYNLWCPGGSATPASVAEAVMEAALRRVKVEVLPATFDGAVLRRGHPGVDAEISRGVSPG